MRWGWSGRGRRVVATAVAMAMVPALAVALLPAAAAEPLAATLEVRGTARFAGAGDAELAWSGSLRDARLGHDAPAGRLAVRGEAVLLSLEYLDAGMEDSSPPGHSRASQLLRASATPLGPLDGPLQVLSWTEHGSVRLLPGEPVPRAVAGDFELSAPRAMHAALARLPDAHPPEERAAVYPPLGGVAALALGEAGFRGRLVLTGATVATPEGTVDATWTSSGLQQPGLGGAVVRTARVLVVEGDVQADDSGWQQAFAGLRGPLRGDLVLENARGSGLLNGTPLPPGIHLFQARGDLDVEATYTGVPARWSASGESDFVAVNAEALAGQRFPAWPVAAGIGLAALLAGLLAKGWRLLAAAIPGLHLADPLGKPARLRLLGLVSDHPGVDQVNLARRAGMGRASVRHHLRVLKDAEYLTERVVGRRRTYTLNSGSFDFVLPGTRNLAGDAAALLHHPKRQGLFDALEHGECDVPGLLGRLAAAGLAVSAKDASYHLGLLAQAGLVSRRQSGPRASWRLNVTREQMLSTQRGRFLTGLRKELHDRLTDEAQAPAELRAQVARRSSRREVANELRLLAAIGYAAMDGQGRFLRRPDG